MRERSVRAVRSIVKSWMVDVVKKRRYALKVAMSIQ